MLVFLAALPAVVVAVARGTAERQAARASVDAELQTHARRLLSEQSGARAAAFQLLTSMSRLPALSDGGSKGCNELLSRLLGGSGLFGNLGLLGLDGRVICAATPPLPEVNPSASSYFKRAVETGGFVSSHYQLDPASGAGSLEFALAVKNHEQQVGSVLIASLELARLVSTAHPGNLPRDSRITLLDPRFQVVARMPRDGWLGKSIVGTRLHRQLTMDRPVSMQAGSGLTAPDRLHVVTRAHDESGDLQGYIVISIPEHYVSGPANQALVRESGLLALIVIAIVAIAFIGGHLLVLQRLKPILGATRRITAGDFTARTSAGKDANEFSVLENAFNEMAARIEGDMEHISGLNRTYAILADINGAIFRIRDSQALVDELCRVAVESGGFQAACIYLVDENVTQARLAAHAGAGKEVFLPIIAGIHEPVLRDNGPITRSLKTGRPVVEQDVAASAAGAWRGQIQKIGAGSVGSFPLSFSSKLKGTFALYSLEPRAFDEEEVRLFVQLASNTSLGLEMAEKESRLYQLTNYDLITGLPNRALFEDRISQALVRAPRGHTVAAVLLLRVERFRQINDRFGWAGCDTAVKRISQHLAKLLRPGDTVARIADDQFGVLLDDVRRVEDIVATADRLIAGYPRAVSWSGQEILLQASMGIAAYPNDGQDAQTLLHNAQVALDNITLRRGNVFAFYAADLDRKAHARHLIETQLAHAIERGELSIAYQPVVRIHDRKVTGAEALLRWESRSLGQVAPASFVSIAEQVGLIAGIGKWVFEATCAQRIAWRRPGTDDFRISANVSIYQLRQPDFLESVEQILRRTGLDPRQVAFGIELTETELMEQIDRMVPILRTMRSLGIYLSIDDFGTGYSSLSYLWRLPVDALKIDLSFVRDIATDENAQNVAASIVTLGHSLNIHVVAEGVETTEQLRVLEAMGCDSAQGYLFSHPVPAEAFEKFLD